MSPFHYLFNQSSQLSYLWSHRSHNHHLYHIKSIIVRIGRRRIDVTLGSSFHDFIGGQNFVFWNLIIIILLIFSVLLPSFLFNDIFLAISARFLE
ncbi:unnamed protein product [Rhizophagus irregularis]|nr:unnamed protein product [Rhizophagus irregularis]